MENDGATWRALVSRDSEGRRRVVTTQPCLEAQMFGCSLPRATVPMSVPDCTASLCGRCAGRYRVEEGSCNDETRPLLRGHGRAVVQRPRSFAPVPHGHAPQKEPRIFDAAVVGIAAKNTCCTCVVYTGRSLRCKAVQGSVYWWCGIPLLWVPPPWARAPCQAGPKPALWHSYTCLMQKHGS